MTQRYVMLPRHLLVPVGADSVACSCSRTKMLQSVSTSAKRKALQSLLQTGLSCNHCTILGLVQFEGRGLGRMLWYSVAQRTISQRYSPFCGRMEVFGSFDHGSLSKEKSSAPSSSNRPIASRCRVFFEFCAFK
jgi:hypothetical protein